MFLYPCYFFNLLFGWLMASFWLLSRKESHLKVNYCVWAINVLPEGIRESHGRSGSLCLVECQVEFEPGTFQFDCKASIHLTNLFKLQKVVSPDLRPVFLKCGNSSNTQKRFDLNLRWFLGLSNISLDAKVIFQDLYKIQKIYKSTHS